jgi:hypothetical protein
MDERLGLMKKAILLCLLGVTFAVGFPVLAAEKLPTLIKQSNSIEAFVPKGWKLLDKTSGDLNKDGLADIAGVLEPETQWEPGMEEAPPRILLIALQERGKGYRLSIQTAKAILRADEGVAWGDPYESVSVDRGSLLLNFYGGSGWRWAYTYRFRYQDQGWFLIGVTEVVFFTGTQEGKVKDYNLLTGKMIEIKQMRMGILRKKQ